MSDAPTDVPAADQPAGDTPDDSGGNDGNIKALRNKADKADTLEGENAGLKREIAFMKAGVDTESPVGKMFAKAWDGDPNDLDGLKAAWAEVAPAATDSTTPPETAPTPEGFQNPEDQQQHRDQVAGSGQPAGSTPEQTPNPVDQAYERFHGDKSLPIEERQEGAMATVLESYFKGDKRVMFDGAAHRDKAMRIAADEILG